MTFTLDPVPGVYAICRLGPDQPVPAWATNGPFFALARTPTELSAVCEASGVPDGVACERPWRLLTVRGPLDFALTGVLASLVVPLAAARVGVFAVSTYDTDYLLVREHDFDRAVVALRGGGHVVSGP